LACCIASRDCIGFHFLVPCLLLVQMKASGRIAKKSPTQASPAKNPRAKTRLISA